MTSESVAGKPLPSLVAPLADVERELAGQVAKGYGYRALGARNADELRTYFDKVRAWSDYNEELLRRRFSTADIAEEYGSSDPLGDPSLTDVDKGLDMVRLFLSVKTTYLARLKERLSLFDDGPSAEAPPPDAPKQQEAATIFVVHGRHRGAEQEVLRFLDRVTDLRATVLHEQPNRGRTVIEKFEEHAGHAAFVVVLLTADDEGRERHGTELVPRARQNVIFELGYFFGKGDRARVAALYEPGTELPSDINGLAYIELDDREGWKIALCREMQAAGVVVHKDKIF